MALMSEEMALMSGDVAGVIIGECCWSSACKQELHEHSG